MVRFFHYVPYPSTAKKCSLTVEICVHIVVAASRAMLTLLWFVACALDDKVSGHSHQHQTTREETRRGTVSSSKTVVLTLGCSNH
eukprot:5004991-Amphidinium_carterae.1